MFTRCIFLSKIPLEYVVEYVVEIQGIPLDFCCVFHIVLLWILQHFMHISSILQPSYSTSFLCGKHANKGHFTSFYILWILNPCWKKWYTVLSSTAGWPNAGRSNSEVQIAESRSCRQVNGQMMSGDRNPEGPDS